MFSDLCVGEGNGMDPAQETAKAEQEQVAALSVEASAAELAYQYVPAAVSVILSLVNANYFSFFHPDIHLYSQPICFPSFSVRPNVLRHALSSPASRHSPICPSSQFGHFLLVWLFQVRQTHPHKPAFLSVHQNQHNALAHQSITPHIILNPI